MAEIDLEADQIVRSLSKSQRQALLWCSADGSAKVHEKGAPREVSFFAIRKVIKGNLMTEVASIYSLVRDGRSDTVKCGLWPASTWALTSCGYPRSRPPYRGAKSMTETDLLELASSMTEDEKLLLLDQTDNMADIVTPLAGLMALGLAFPETSAHNVTHPKVAQLGLKVRDVLSTPDKEVKHG